VTKAVWGGENITKFSEFETFFTKQTLFKGAKMIPYFQLPSLSFRRRKNDVDLETLFIHPEREKNTVTGKEHFAETPAAKNTDSEARQTEPLLSQEASPVPLTETIVPLTGNSVPPAETTVPLTEEYRPAEFPAGYRKQESESRSPEKHRFLRTASQEELAFHGTKTKQAEEKFSAEQSSRLLQENATPEKKSDVQLSAAISALTECARGQLRYLKKNYDLLKTQTDERYFN
jgi:hypothetical protein